MALPFIDDISGTIRGYRIFTACRCVRGKIFRLEDHLDRLYNCAQAIYMQPPLPRDQLRALLNELMEKNSHISPGTDLVVKIIFSGGLEGSTMKQSGRGAHLYIAVQVLEPPEPAAYEKGVALATFRHQRFWAEVKLLNYVAAVVASQTVVPARDAYDVLFVDPTDNQTILEGSTFTAFFVTRDGTILTPPLDGKILDSITRRALLDLAVEQPRFSIIERSVRMDELPSFTEAFIASTTRNVLPVVRIDDCVIGDGVPGPITKALIKAFQNCLDTY
ncbi:MAG: aminotransferase class IV [Thermodesulfobacteriota bacterium]